MQNSSVDYKRALEFAAVILLVVIASATSFIWFPVAAAAAGIALAGVLLGWAAHEVWTWVYDSQNPVKIHPLKKITGLRPRGPSNPLKPVSPAA